MTSSSSSSFTNNLVSNNSKEMDTVSWGIHEHNSNGIGMGIEIPTFKSFTPSSLPLSPPPVSPSSYLAIPSGLSAAELLDSPVFFSTSTALPSPTTGAFAGQSFNWRSNSSENQQGVKREEKKSQFDFSFQTQARPLTTSSSSLFQSSSNIFSGDSIKVQQEAWKFNEVPKQANLRSLDKPGIKSEFTQIQSFSTETKPFENNNNNTASQQNYTHFNQPSQYLREQRRSEDGYNWRKYGQKQVKGSENPRSYYKCTHPNCPTKKKVERSLDGHITEIVYKGSHNHPKPQSTRRSLSQSIQLSAGGTNSDISDQSFAPTASATVQEDSSLSVGEDEFDHASPFSNSGGDDDLNEPEAKRWKEQSETEGLLAAGSKTVREPRVVVQTTSDIDILDDGYRWRKYGQKVVKGNPNPRSYYKCTSVGCPVRKHVERASHDTRAVITTYEGKHNHDVPAARGSGYSLNKPAAINGTTNTNVPIPIRPSSVLANQSNYASFPNSLQNNRVPVPTPGSEARAPSFTFDMLQSPGSFEFSGFEKPIGSNYMNQMQHSGGLGSGSGSYSGTKEEPKDNTFDDSFNYMY